MCFVRVLTFSDAAAPRDLAMPLPLSVNTGLSARDLHEAVLLGSSAVVTDRH